jgi:hypothetical protein
MLLVYEGRMIARIAAARSLPRPAVLPVLLALGIGAGLGLGGCADMSDSLTVAFADPAKYDLYECKQLEAERGRLATRSAELQGLMAKADTGVAGPLVAELAYRNEYVAVRGQTRLADEAWRRNKCVATGVAPAAPAVSSTPPEHAKGARSRSGSAVY